ncbi:MAG TPA: glycosyltransferase family 2 protein [Gaiellaceae bacterium]|nr:glycosyltransferase family 2 protein [Gaiellaceae bacterium]HWJ43870.1 glycosyltransferase family 2 protein [Gaiellaceae bacterium]
MPDLSVVIPVRNEAAELPRTLGALQAAIERSGFSAEIVLVDDGSDDRSAEAARGAANGLPLNVVRLPGSGRFEARRAGLEAATGELVLLLDSRVRLAPDSLHFLYERVAAGERVWNGHVNVDPAAPFGVFWSLLAELAWREYFDNPRTTSFGIEEFDDFPKGTTCFVAPREQLLSAFDGFRTHYRDLRLANDDTPILRTIASQTRIGISPQFACTYEPRTTPGRFFRHAVHRGTVFVDGHGTPESRFYPAVLAFFPLSAAVLLRPRLVPLALAACGVAAAAYGLQAGRSRREVAVLAAVTPVYAAGHGLGMWRGLLELLR